MERAGRCGQRGKVRTEDGNRSFRVFEANKMISAFTLSEMGNNWEILHREEEPQGDSYFNRIILAAP